MVYFTKKPTIESKAQILGAEARYDTTGIPRTFQSPFTRKAERARFIYPSVGKHGECIPLFKVLQSNFCIHDCYYCLNRRGRDCRRTAFQPEELAELFINYYKKGLVKGFFLSSAVYPTPDKAQERMLATIEILRRQYKYRGYIHAVVLPGADFSYIHALGRYADRLSINLEAPSGKYLRRLTPTKDFQGQLWRSLTEISRYSRENRLSAGVTTQLVVGAAGERDSEIVDLSQRLYSGYGLSRVYYSGFEPVPDTPLEGGRPCLRLREVRLYQADFLLRRYGFKAEELVFNGEGNLSLEKDPKLSWAERHPEFFPVEITTASYPELIRVPGIGTISARRILKERATTLEGLLKAGAVTKRAQRFITINGKGFTGKETAKSRVSEQLFLWEEL